MHQRIYSLSFELLVNVLNDSIDEVIVKDIVVGLQGLTPNPGLISE